MANQYNDLKAQTTSLKQTDGQCATENNPALTGEQLLRQKIMQYLPGNAAYPKTETPAIDNTPYTTPVQDEKAVGLNPQQDTDNTPEENEDITLEQHTINETDFSETIYDDTEEHIPDEPLDEELAADKLYSFLNSSFFSRQDTRRANEPKSRVDSLAASLRDSFLSAEPPRWAPDTIDASETNNVSSILRQEMEFIAKRREEENARIAELHQERVRLEEQFRQVEENLKDDIMAMERRKNEEKMKLNRIHETRIAAEEKLNKQERELRRAVEELELRKLRELKMLDTIDRKRTQQETALRQLDDLLKTELESIDKRISTEKSALHALNIQTITAQEQLQEYELLLQSKKEEFKTKQADYTKSLQSAQDEIENIRAEHETIKEHLSNEINDIISHRDRLQDEISRKEKEFDIQQRNRLGEKERLEDELARINKYCTEERNALYTLKDEKVQLEQSLNETEQQFQAVVRELGKRKDLLEFQIEQLKEKYNAERKEFENKRNDLYAKERELQQTITQQQDTLKSIQASIETARNDFHIEQERIKLEKEEIEQDKQFAAVQLKTLLTAVEEQTSLYEELEKEHNDKLASVQSELEEEEQKLYSLRTRYADEKRQLERQIKDTQAAHQDEINEHKTQMHQLSAEKQRIQSGTDQLFKRHELLSEELEQISSSKRALTRDIETLNRQKDQELKLKTEEAGRIHRDIERLQELYQTEQQELELITKKRQKAEEDLQSRLRVMEAEIDALSQQKLELKLRAVQTN
ncbi:MAG: hypothetical protein C4541_11015 [Candidatus Auribacter fodinae]|jgi:myosin protein heavy chain|uniref:Uncharacterized protein n=1 Tax=Candidatus Auribacter fodinae TaxID=2093366 RepID=A0A3A4QWD1_9BACT|nr:MAG: hypothetical protein C4541_11015 [Candidatus Auribacter fodinae]